MKQKCSVCGANADSTLCWKHKKHTLKQNKSLRANTALKRHFKPKEEQSINPMWEFFLSIWNERKHISEVSGEKLPSPPTSLYFHHIILKSFLKRKNLEEFIYDKEDIVLLTPNEHTEIHSDMYKFEKINKQRDYLYKKYSIFV